MGRAGSTGFFNGSVNVEMPLREEIAARDGLSQSSKEYPSQPLLMNFFPLNSPTVLDLGHTTTSSSANQKKQFEMPAGLEVALVSYEPLNNLFLRTRKDGLFGVRGQPGWSPILSVVGSAVRVSVASQ